MDGRTHPLERPGIRRLRLFSVAVELTAACNQKCLYCYNEWRGDGGAKVATGGSDLVLARLTRLLDTFDIQEITLSGGEPFTRPDLFVLLDLLRSRGVSAHIISNGGLIDAEIAERLQEYPLSFVQITLNGPDPELHAAHVGKGHFEATLEGIRALTGAGVKVAGCIVLTRKNASCVADILELWRSLGVTQIALSRFSPAGYAAGHVAELLPSRSDLRLAFSQAAPYARDYGMTLRVTMPVPPCAVEVEQFPEILFGSCPVGTDRQEFAIGPDGKVRHCTLHHSRLGDGKDILDESFDLRSLLASPEVTEYRRVLPAFCRGCLHATSCGGGCGAAAEWVFGSRQMPDPLVSQHIDDDFAAELEGRRSGARIRLPVLE